MIDRATRLGARHIILNAANRVRSSWAAKPYTMRSIQRAACAARRGRLVSDEVLIAAGFKPRGRFEQPTLTPADKPARAIEDVVLP